MNSDEIQVPTYEIVQEGGKIEIYCRGCQCYFGIKGHEETLEHCVTDCINALTERWAELKVSHDR